jgi:hypothetical protein
MTVDVAAEARFVWRYSMAECLNLAEGNFVYVFQISARRPAILIEDFRCFPQSLQVNSGKVPS